MTKQELIVKELSDLNEQGGKLLLAFKDKKEKLFAFEYQDWYTKAIKTISVLAPDRLVEFKGYYEIDPKRKEMGYGTYVIQDFLKNVAPGSYHYPNFDTRGQTFTCFLNQITILKSIESRITSILANIHGELFSEIQDSEVLVARELIKVSPRAAGALVGVLIESHLQNVAKTHNIKIQKKNPTIADLNDPLKAASIIDIPQWRKISYLADLRNLCSHKKDTDPTKEQVDELVSGAEWVVKNIN